MHQRTATTIFTVVLIALTIDVEAQLSSSQKEFILSAHNQYRSNAAPTAANMLKMEWDDELAAVAQAYSENCVFDHNPNRNTEAPSHSSVGENLATRAPFTTWGETELQALMDGWEAEKSDYTFSSNSCSSVCGHYTQLVWATSDKVGCGITLCPTLTIPSSTSFTNALNLVCNYGPAGNFVGMSPFIQGSPCSQCPSGYGGCEDNLCTMGDSVTTNAPTTNPPDTTAPGTNGPDTTQQPATTTAVPTTPRPTPRPRPTRPLTLVQQLRLWYRRYIAFVAKIRARGGRIRPIRFIDVLRRARLG